MGKGVIKGSFFLFHDLICGYANEHSSKMMEFEFDNFQEVEKYLAAKIKVARQWIKYGEEWQDYEQTFFH